MAAAVAVRPAGTVRRKQSVCESPWTGAQEAPAVRRGGLDVSDIEGARPTKVIQRPRVADRYSLGPVAEPPVEVPRFVRDSIPVDDIEGACPKGGAKASGRNPIDYSDVEGSRPRVRPSKSKQDGAKSVRDVTHPQFVTKRSCNPQMPTYVMRYRESLISHAAGILASPGQTTYEIGPIAGSSPRPPPRAAQTWTERGAGLDATGVVDVVRTHNRRKFEVLDHASSTSVCMGANRPPPSSAARAAASPTPDEQLAFLERFSKQPRPPRFTELIGSPLRYRVSRVGYRPSSKLHSHGKARSAAADSTLEDDIRQVRALK